MAVEITAAWIGGGCTIIAATIAFGTLAYQGHQNREADRRARQQAFNELLYRDGIVAARGLSNVAGSFMSKLIMAQQQVHLAILMKQRTGEVRPPMVTYPEFLSLNRECADALIDLVFLFEERRIADPNLDVIRRAFLAIGHDIREAFSSALQWKLMQFLQHQLPDGTIVPYDVPSAQSFEKLEMLVGEIISPLSTLSAFCEDLIVELQNAHLSDVFSVKLDHRQPGDPSSIVLDLSNASRIEAWIKSSAWERQNREVEARFAAQPESLMHHRDTYA